MMTRNKLRLNCSQTQTTMSDPNDLSGGFCAQANVANSSDDIAYQPVLQVLSIKKIQGGTGLPDRHRVIVSDGVQFMQAMLSTTINDLVNDNILRRNCVIKLTKWEPQDLKGQR
jgi:replication factor A1